MTKFILKKEYHDLVRNLFHDDYANKIINLKEGQDFFIDRGFPLDKIEKVKEITPIEELLNVLSMRFNEVANNNVIDKEYWIEKANKFRSNSIIDMLRVFVDYVNKKQPSYGHIPDEWIRDFAVEDNAEKFLKDSNLSSIADGDTLGLKVVYEDDVINTPTPCSCCGKLSCSGGCL